MDETPQVNKSPSRRATSEPEPSSSSSHLALPSPDVLDEIARKQDARAAEIRAARAERRRSKLPAGVDEEQSRAAVLIQRNFRGHRTRRAMQGFSMDPSLRWIEVRALFSSFWDEVGGVLLCEEGICLLTVGVFAGAERRYGFAIWVNSTIWTMS